jgi:hypothetical protein
MNPPELSQIRDLLLGLYQRGADISPVDLLNKKKWMAELRHTVLGLEQSDWDGWLERAEGTADDPVKRMHPWPQLKRICHMGTTASLRPPDHAELVQLLAEILLYIDAHTTPHVGTTSDGAGDSSQSTGKQHDGPKTPHLYMCLTHEGAKSIDEGQYRDIVAAAHDGGFDLFIDAVTGAHGYRPAGDNDFKLGKKALSPQQASYLTELVEEKRPVSPYKLKMLDKIKHPRKLLLAARRLVETDGSNSNWRVFRSVQQDGVTTYHFSPPPGFTYAVIRLLPPSSS